MCFTPGRSCEKLFAKNTYLRVILQVGAKIFDFQDSIMMKRSVDKIIPAIKVDYERLFVQQVHQHGSPKK